MQRERDRLQATLNRKGISDVCIACGQAGGWDVWHVGIPVLNPAHTALVPGRAIKSVAFICQHCGFFRIHSRDHLFHDPTQPRHLGGGAQDPGVTDTDA